MNTLLCLSLTYSIVMPKIRLEFDLFAKQTNMNKYFFKPTQTIHKQLDSFTTLIMVLISI